MDVETLIARAAQPHRAEVIETMRATIGDDQEPVTVEQLDTLVAGIVTMTPLEELTTQTGLSQPTVLDTISSLGTWLTHSKGTAEVDVVLHTEVDQLPLLQVPLPPMGKKKRNKDAARAYRREQLRRKRLRRHPNRVIVPPGLSPGEVRRNVLPSIGAIAAARPGKEDLVRFVARTYRSRKVDVTFELVSAIWFFAAVGRLNEVSGINAKHPGFNAAVIDAYDLLDGGRCTAMRALGELINPNSSLDTIRAGLWQVSPLFEAETQRLIRAVDRAFESAHTEAVLRRELRFWGERVAAAPAQYAIRSIAELNSGQVRRLCQAAGLPVETSTTATKNEIRKRLRAMGQLGDADIMVPLGIRAVHSGHEPLFWDAIDSFVAGDPAWDHQLSAAGIT